ncbi:hypothetical protein HANVADRAFT_53540 [Hanseniaspora valbyensis NRRL Y-1626]|uniref:Uncharacterized protein n=1 Tax=Hanseniaspora valbyensis NRRL Y-1626 TaxID=766949 RepID=A0A1B7TB19_9ASCO|nr:hypothetical protein HANVADRAFT_53540 [Hanseniaspora valbyensis NRRL Y-1626]
MSASELSYNNTSSSDLFFKELMTRNMGLILKSCGFDGIESRFLLNYLTDLHLKIIESFIKELGTIMNSNDNSSEEQVLLSDLRFLLNKFNIICDKNYNIDETVLQIKDSTNNKNNTVIEEANTQGIEYFQKWVEENTVYNFDFKNLTKKLKIKNLNVFNSNIIDDETREGQVEKEKENNNDREKDLAVDETIQILNIPDNIDPNQNLDWITFNFLNSLQDREKVIAVLNNKFSGIKKSLEECFESNENNLNEKNDLLDSIIAPDFLRELSFAKKRKFNFLENEEEIEEDINNNNNNNNPNYPINAGAKNQLTEKQNEVIKRLNDFRNRKQFKLSFEEKNVNNDVDNKVDEILEELDDMKIPDIPISEDVEIDLNWLGEPNDF